MGRHHEIATSPMKEYEGLAARLLQCRQEAGLSAQDAARAIGIHAETLRLTEQARRSPTVREVRSYAAFYKKTIAYFIGEDGA